MSSLPLKLGSLIPLHHQLGEYDEGRFVHAIIKDDTGAELAGSPVDLADSGDGLYTDKSQTMGSKILIVTYQTFKDAGKTKLSDDQAGLDVFYPAAILDPNDGPQQAGEVFGVISQQGAVNAGLTAGEIAARIESEGRLKADLASGSISGKMGSDGNLKASMTRE